MRPGMVLGISVFFSTSQYRKYRLSPALGWLQEVRTKNIETKYYNSFNNLTKHLALVALGKNIRSKETKSPAAPPEKQIVGLD